MQPVTFWNQILQLIPHLQILSIICGYRLLRALLLILQLDITQRLSPEKKKKNPKNSENAVFLMRPKEEKRTGTNN